MEEAQMEEAQMVDGSHPNLISQPFFYFDISNELLHFSSAVFLLRYLFAPLTSVHCFDSALLEPPLSSEIWLDAYYLKKKSIANYAVLNAFIA